MRGFLKVKVFVVLLALAGKVIAGNPDRAGQSGASEILINPWAQSSGWYGLNVASIQGLESMNVNVAGLTFINRTDMTFSRTEWLVGSDISINSFGIAQKVGEGAIGLSLVNFNLGDIPVTTTASPEGTGATFRPRLSNFALSYSRKFADYLSGGLTIRGISENISDLKAFGVALDVGIQYITGPEEHPEQMKMGVTLKNIGSPMRYGGDGITFRGNVPEGTYTATVGLGLEYGLKVKNTEMFLLRAGYRYEDGMLSSNADERTTAHTGLAAGVTFQTAFANSSSNMLSISYSYRSSNPYDGTHSFGIRLSI